SGGSRRATRRPRRGPRRRPPARSSGDSPGYARPPTPLHDDTDGGLHRRDDPFLLLSADSAPHRRGEVLRRGPLGLRKRARLVAEIRHRRLEVERRHVVRGGRDPCLFERRGDALALGRPHDVHVVDVPGLVERQLDRLPEPQVRVARGRLAPRTGPARATRKEDAQRCRLDRVESGVRPDELEGPLVARAVEAELADGVRDRRIGARDEPDVAERAVSLHATSPPSPSAKRFFVGKKLNVEQTPVVAIPGAPNACAASSSSGTPSVASSASGAGRPKRCTGTMAVVRSLTSGATEARSRLSVTGSTSANTGVAPTRAIASAVAKKVNAGQITSSWRPTPIASSARTSASVPL